MSPRKSSTSSAERPSPRSRYLGLEVAGDQPLPPSPRWLEHELGRLAARGPESPPLKFRIIRWEGRRGLVEVGHFDLAWARERWNATIEGATGRRFTVKTHRTWGTLRKGKLWLRPQTVRPSPGTVPARS